ncbi:hypothetical protein OPT61_g309 [Boeremia exigua]|uniref:Uncharacterized protein n=1 Tax=Boeremia exigua TaxID=749465 RepID=A0ACC2IU94_9PLEO|nr:hypothetical protein OPT61_g309 [Boeremia exigua]
MGSRPRLSTVTLDSRAFAAPFKSFQEHCLAFTLSRFNNYFGVCIVTTLYPPVIVSASHVAAVMASYFDLPAGADAPAADASKEGRGELQSMGLFSPQVSRILDDLQFEDGSSSTEDSEEDNSSSENDEESRLSDDDTQIDDSLSRKSRQGPSSTTKIAHGTKSSARSGSRGTKGFTGHTIGDKSSKNPRSHMARFQSLRSTLFQVNIENSMKQCHEEAEAREKAATSWKAQHEKRQGYSRPHTPEKEKDGFGRRIGMKIRRLTNKETPTIANIEENTGNLTRRESTATDDDEEPHGDPWKPRQSYESSINHSDVDELVRWVSRRDPPSDGEHQSSSVKASKKEDSGHESLGHSDIEELVRHASRKSISTEPVLPVHMGYSDESTASDSDPSQADDVQDEGSVEGSLSRWVSRRDGAMAGPIRQQRSAFQIEPDTEADDSDVPEIGRWRTHHDDTSGESITGSSEIAKKDDISVLEAKRGRSRDRSPRFEDKDQLQDDDVDELVRWVSRRDSKQMSSPEISKEDTVLQRQEHDKKEQVGMTIDDKSLGPEDLDDLLAHVRDRKMSGLNTGITPVHV